MTTIVGADTTAGSSAYGSYSPNNGIVCSRFVAGANGSAKSIFARVSAQGQTYRAAIYNSAGTTKLGDTVAVADNGSFAAQLLQFTLNSPVTIVSGTSYLLCLYSSGNYVLPYVTGSGTPNDYEQGGFTYPTWPSSLSLASTGGFGTMAIWADDPGAIEQEGFRFYNDDGNEAGATAIAAQDTNISQVLDLATTIRLLMNVTGDPVASLFQLEYKKSSDPSYTKVQALLAAGTVTYGAIGTNSSGTTSCTPAYPSGITAATSQLFCFVSGRSNTANTAPTMPAGWTNIADLESGAGTFGVDAGTRRVTIFKKDTVAGTESGTVTVSLAGNANNTLAASIVRFEINAGYTLDYSVGTGADTNGGTSFNAASTSNITFKAGDYLAVHCAESVDTATQSSISITATGVTFGTRNAIRSMAITAGFDHRHIIEVIPVSSVTGTPNVAPSYGFTASTATAGPAAFLRLRSVAPDQPIVLEPSSNIATVGISLLSATKVNNGATFTPAAGSNRIMLVASALKNLGLALQDVQYNSLTRTPSVQVTDSADADRDACGVCVFKESEINASATSITSRWASSPTDDINNFVFLLSGVDQTAPVRVTGSAFGTLDGSSFTSGINLTVEIGDFLVSVVAFRANITGFINPRNAWTESFDISSGAGGQGAHGAAYTIADATTETAQWADTGGGPQEGYALAAIAIAPLKNYTTARLTAPSGKTTSDFVPGLISDDTNPLTAIDITADDYTEIAWNIKPRAPAVNGDVYTFRVTLAGVPIDTYTVTPQMTIGASHWDLVVADATHGHTADNLALTQANTLAVADALHGHEADNLSLSQGYTLVVVDALHDHTADNLDLVQAAVLAVADALHGHTADNLELTQANTLAIQDALHGHTADEIALIQANLLAVADALHGHTAENVDLSLGFTLAVLDALHGHTADNLILTQANLLEIADALHGHSADNLTLTPADTLTVQDALHAHLADTLALVQANTLAVLDALHGHTAESPALTQANTLVVADALHGHTVENIELSFAALLAVADALHAHLADNLSLTQANLLVVQDALHLHTVDTVALTQANMLLVLDALHGHTAESPTLSMVNILVVADALHGHTADNIQLAAGVILAIQDALHAHFADTLALSQASILIVNDALHGHLADNITLRVGTPESPVIFVIEGVDRLFIIAPVDTLFTVDGDPFKVEVLS